jgi:hypothetical protein
MKKKLDSKAKPIFMSVLQSDRRHSFRSNEVSEPKLKSVASAAARASARPYLMYLDSLTINNHGTPTPAPLLFSFPPALRSTHMPIPPLHYTCVLDRRVHELREWCSNKHMM